MSRTEKRKYGHYIISVLFFLFAIVQWNDPDPYLWIVLYLAIAVVPLFYLKDNLNTFIIGAGLFVLMLITATYVPALVKWVGEGMPTITGSMHAESPHIELIREFFGLVLSLAVLGYYYVKSKVSS